MYNYIKSDFFGKIFETLVPEETGLKETLLIQNSSAFENGHLLPPLIYFKKPGDEEFSEIILDSKYPLPHNELGMFLSMNATVFLAYWNNFPEKMLNDLIKPI